MPGGHVRTARESLDVQRLRVLPVDPVADATQPREVAQVRRSRGFAGHLRNRATSRRSCLVVLCQIALTCGNTATFSHLGVGVRIAAGQRNLLRPWTAGARFYL